MRVGSDAIGEIGAIGANGAIGLIGRTMSAMKRAPYVGGEQCLGEVGDGGGQGLRSKPSTMAVPVGEPAFRIGHP